VGTLVQVPKLWWIQPTVECGYRARELRATMLVGSDHMQVKARAEI
jgi:hypothetical protein